MHYLLTCLMMAAALSAANAKEIILELEVVSIDNTRAVGGARLISERIEEVDSPRKWRLTPDPARQWEEVVVEWDAASAPPQKTQMRYHLTYGKLRDLMDSEFRFVAVVSGRQFWNPVVETFLAKLRPEPTRSDPPYLMRTHREAMSLWQLRHEHLARFGLAPYKHDIRLAYWALRTARDLYEVAGFEPGADARQVVDWTKELLADDQKAWLFGSDTATRGEFSAIIDHLDQRDRILLQQAMHAIEEDISRDYLPKEQSRGCEAATHALTYLQELGPAVRRRADPNGSYFLRAASNTALCRARLLNRRPLVERSSLDQLLRDSDRVAGQIVAMLAHPDFEGADTNSRRFAGNEATNLRRAVSDVRQELAQEESGERVFGLLGH